MKALDGHRVLVVSRPSCGLLAGLAQALRGHHVCGFGGADDGRSAPRCAARGRMVLIASTISWPKIFPSSAPGLPCVLRSHRQLELQRVAHRAALRAASPTRRSVSSLTLVLLLSLRFASLSGCARKFIACAIVFSMLAHLSMNQSKKLPASHSLKSASSRDQRLDDARRPSLGCRPSSRAMPCAARRRPRRSRRSRRARRGCRGRSRRLPTAKPLDRPHRSASEVRDLPERQGGGADLHRVSTAQWLA
jgi:hypothetical protein